MQKNIIDHVNAEAPPKIQITPFLKWAGGKRWLAEKLAALATETGFVRYIEPFLGSGAVFFRLEPVSAILSDSNQELINAYRALKEDFSSVFVLLQEHQRHHSTDYYYKMRSYRPRCEFRQAARFIYLNRTCWNGLYRVNLSGEFNVPKGTKETVLLDSDNWNLVSRLLQNAELRVSDFEEVIDSAKSGDFIFSDPPYTVKHNFNGFIKYNEKIFSWEDQIRLRDSLLSACRRGAKVVVTNANHSSIQTLYSQNFNLRSLTRQSVLAGDVNYRGKFEELLISCI